jgi:glycosyltransferase involved in cell wall biosynthesis
VKQQKALTISLVIPAFNEEKHLTTCLDAVAAQTSPFDEVIVVDNNSHDDTARIAQNYSSVRVIHEPNQGIVHARNTGFNAARSDIIGRIDADTHLPVDWVERVREFYADDNHASHCYTGNSYFYNLKMPRLSSWWQGQLAFRLNRLLMGHYILYGSNMTIPRTVWRHVEPSVCTRQDIHEDLDLAIHVHRAGYSITYQEGFKVGVKMRRVLSDRRQLWPNLKMWPETLKHHGRWTWIIGWLGVLLMYIGSFAGFLLRKKPKQ